MNKHHINLIVFPKQKKPPAQSANALVEGGCVMIRIAVRQSLY